MTNDRHAVLAMVTLAVALTAATLLLTGALILTRLRAIATFLMLLFVAVILTRLIADLALSGLLLTRLLSFLVLLILLVTLILIGHEAPLEMSPVNRVSG